MTKDQRRNRLVRCLTTPTSEMRKKLRELKRKGQEGLERDDFLWHYLLQSFSTWGNSRGWQGLIGDRGNYGQVVFPVLQKMMADERPAHIENVLRVAKVSRAARKAGLLSQNVALVEALGGLVAAKEAALAQEGTAAKIRFMKRFHGIGDKYARNIWMDVYHPDFHGTIAVDDRIKAMSRALGYSFGNYAEHEAFYQQIAEEAGLQAWEVDRLIYNFKDRLIQSLDATAQQEDGHGR